MSVSKVESKEKTGKPVSKPFPKIMRLKNSNDFYTLHYNEHTYCYLTGQNAGYQYKHGTGGSPISSFEDYNEVLCLKND